MEHRHSGRKKLNAEVVLFRDGGVFAQGQCVNIGLGGMKVSILSAKHTLQKNRLLELEFHLPLSHDALPFREAAMVVHSSAAEIGLMFTRHNLELERALKKGFYSLFLPQESALRAS